MVKAIINKFVSNTTNSKWGNRFDITRTNLSKAYSGSKNIFSIEKGLKGEQYLNKLARRKLTDNASKALSLREQPYKDWRARLGISPIMNPYYAETNYRMLGSGGFRTITQDGFGLLRLLTTTGGMLFPYTPTIHISQNVSYDTQQTLQSNYNMNNWTGTPPPSIQVSGKFTAANAAEAYYMLAVIHFLRCMVKGDTGFKTLGKYQEDIKLGRGKENMVRGVLGAPPPILYFSAYGECMFNEVPVIIQSYNYNLKDDIDYIELILDPITWELIKDPTKRTSKTLVNRVPMELDVSLNLLIQQNPKRMRDKFNLYDFKNGNMFKIAKENSGWTF